MAAFHYRASYSVVLKPQASLLSLSVSSLSKKALADPATETTGRLPPAEHYARLSRKPPAPFLVAGARNVLSNLRCIGYRRQEDVQAAELTAAVATVREENDRPGRPYHAISSRNGVLAVHEFLPDGSLLEPQRELDGVDWLVTGTPVLWDCDAEELFDRMITDAADHSHVWSLPRGTHPDATAESRRRWSVLQDIFVETLVEDRGTAAKRLKAAAKQLSLQRESGYLHSVWGVTDDGNLAIVVANGRLEEVGRQAARLGCRRAVCVENSGSSALYFVTDPAQRPWRPLITAPNFRPAGTAFAFFSLPAGQFRVLE